MATIEGIDISGLHGPKRGSYPAHFFRDEVAWSPSRSRFAIAYTICEVSMSNDVGCIAWGTQEAGKIKIVQNPAELLVSCWGTPFARWISDTKFIIRIQVRDISRLLVPVLVIDTDGKYNGPEKLDSQLSYNQTDEKEKKNVHKTTELQCGVQGKGSA
jgi:hypothetical protein